MHPSPHEYLRHILDEAEYLMSESRGLTIDDFLQEATLTKRSVTLATLLHLPPSLRGAVLWRRSNLDPAVDKARIASSP